MPSRGAAAVCGPTAFTEHFSDLAIVRGEIWMTMYHCDAVLRVVDDAAGRCVSPVALDAPHFLTDDKPWRALDAREGRVIVAGEGARVMISEP